MPQLPNPLTEEHKQCLDVCLENCAVLKDAIREASEMGIDMGDRMQEVEAQEQLARKIKQRRFPLST